jgi:elongation factor P
MAVLAYNEIKLKKVIVLNDEPFLVVASHVFRKQKRKPVNNTKLKSLVSGRVVEQTFHMNETAEEADMETEAIEFIYQSKGEYTFCKAGQPSERFTLPEDLIGDQGKFLKSKTQIDALLFNGDIIGVKIPVKMDLLVKEAHPATKGNTSSGALNEVVLETGATLMVPMFINEGDVIRVNTEDATYAERVSKS